MRASRLLSILLKLQTHGRLTAEQLAEQFEVSVRTVYRDVDHLSEAGVPVVSDRGRSGGFRLLDGFRSELSGLTRDEAETLFLTGLPGPASELGLANLLASARVKLISAVPGGLMSERIASRFHLDPLAWFRAGEDSTHLPTIARATWTDHYLDLQYLNAGVARGRRVRPLGVVLKGGIWYLIAQRQRTIRTYKVSAVVEAKALTRAFKRPRGFDLAAHWEKTARAYEEGTLRLRATVRLSPQGWKRVAMLGDHVARSASESRSAEDPRGWSKCVLPLEGVDQGVTELLRLGEDVEVVGPGTLREALLRRLAILARHHRPSGRGPDDKR
jgi:predicted DNA-binding transcriptional regulator YafY